MEKVYINWTDLKGRSASKNLPIQYTENARHYIIFFTEENIFYFTKLWKDTSNVDGLDVNQNDTDKVDFETNYKGTANAPAVPKTSDRLPKILSAVASDEVSLYVHGKTKVVTGANNEDNNIVDSDFTDEIQLQGMLVAVKDADWGDTVDVEVGYVDAGSNWIKVKSFGESVPMKDVLGWQEYNYKNNAVSKIPATLKIRTRLNQANTVTTKHLLVHYITHK